MDIKIVKEDLKWLQTMKFIRNVIIRSKKFDDISDIEQLAADITNELLLLELEKEKRT